MDNMNQFFLMDSAGVTATKFDYEDVAFLLAEGYVVLDRTIDLGVYKNFYYRKAD